ncbi:DUF6152 family protein [Candidatus Rariloculus sp.]|uniref:DUF6152 family protein n=1 Tax=Candidatus Rariloculus sp. TaxID=3101265 RepID=UPI003D1463F5
MRIKFPAALVLLVCLQTWTAPLSAHHSHGNYSLLEYTHLQGEVREVLWLNPHVWVRLDVTDENGAVATWALEGGSINALTRRGWAQDDLKPGDVVTVRCHQLRDGANGCLLGYLTPPGGEEKEFD